MTTARENRRVYPVDWRELSQFIRFGGPTGACERCGRLHGAEVTQLGDGTWQSAEHEVRRNGRGRRVRGPPGPEVMKAGQPWLAGLAPV